MTKRPSPVSLDFERCEVSVGDAGLHHIQYKDNECAKLIKADFDKGIRSLNLITERE